MLPQCDDVTAAKIAGRPIVSTTATASDHRVERSEWSFVHSETITRTCVTRPLNASGGIDRMRGARHARLTPRPP